jgi:ABC-type transport system involved in Fe-S cluster assembly fused permease/ATPase subunit
LVELCHCSLLYAFLWWTEAILTFTPLIKLNTLPNLVRQAESSIILWSSSCYQFARSAASVCWVGCYEWWWRNASSFKISTRSLCTQVWQAVNRRGWTSRQWHGGTCILTVVCDMLK